MKNLTKTKNIGLILAGVALLVSVSLLIGWVIRTNMVGSIVKDDDMPTDEINISEDSALATFAGGCFWCMESPFEKLPGVSAVVSGYAGGEEENPTYQQVSADLTGHIEAVQIEYDPTMIRYEDLLQVFWRQIDPTDDGGQFVDRGESYTTAIFYHNQEQKRLAEVSLDDLEESGRYETEIVTPIREYTTFYDAEDYHQDYYKKNPTRYNTYRFFSGRDQYLDEIWGEDREYKINTNMAKYTKPSDEELREKLTDLQYDVTQKEKTEKPFDNDYWDNKDEGIYVDIVSGEPLFSSTHKYKSGTGWPSFTQPIDEEFIVEREDRKLWIKRIEIRSKYGDSHLGHVFSDGPEELNGEDSTGLRYCMNSAAMEFVPKEEMEERGYGEYLYLFNK